MKLLFLTIFFLVSFISNAQIPFPNNYFSYNYQNKPIGTLDTIPCIMLISKNIPEGKFFTSPIWVYRGFEVKQWVKFESIPTLSPATYAIHYSYLNAYKKSLDTGYLIWTTK
jgi:hypothetical protein